MELFKKHAAMVVALLALLSSCVGCSTITSYGKLGAERVVDTIGKQLDSACSLEDHEKQAISIYANGEAKKHGRRLVICCAGDERPVCNQPEGFYHTNIGE